MKTISTKEKYIFFFKYITIDSNFKDGVTEDSNLRSLVSKFNPYRSVKYTHTRCSFWVIYFESGTEKKKIYREKRKKANSFSLSEVWMYAYKIVYPLKKWREKGQKFNGKCGTTLLFN